MDVATHILKDDVGVQRNMSEYVVYHDNLPTPIRRNSSTNTFEF